MGGGRDRSGSIPPPDTLPVARRTLLGGFAVAALMPSAASSAVAGETMFGLIGKMRAMPGNRDALIEILLEGTGGMPGCLSYIVAKDVTDPDGIWITEVWDNEASHKASLSLPAFRAAIAKGRPLIAGFDSSATTAPVGGQGLAPL